MGVEEKVIAEARTLFDAAGITHQGDDSILILGLVTSQKRDLDSFFRDDDAVFRLGGFEVHFQPKLDSMMGFLKGLGLEAQIVGPSGYPRGHVLNLKQQAVRAGLGEWGKNSLVLHHEYGPWLRFAAIRIVGTLLPATGPGHDSHDESTICAGCSLCIDACPVAVLEPYFLRDKVGCISNIRDAKKTGKLEVCNRCLEVCPLAR